MYQNFFVIYTCMYLLKPSIKISLSNIHICIYSTPPTKFLLSYIHVCIYWSPPTKFLCYIYIYVFTEALQQNFFVIYTCMYFLKPSKQVIFWSWIQLVWIQRFLSSSQVALPRTQSAILYPKRGKDEMDSWHAPPRV